MKKILTIFLFGIFLISLASAESIGTFEQGKLMQITNYCNDGTCTYMNLTSLELPNGTILYLIAGMTKNIQDFNYSYTPMDLGTYTFKTCGNPSGNVVCDNDEFLVTPSGNSGIDNIILFIIAIVMLYGITILGFYKRNSFMTVLGGMAMLFFGVYIINNGLLIFRDGLTNYIAYLTIGLGGGSALWVIVEEIQDIM